MNPSKILSGAALALAALVVLAACTTTKTIIVQATPNTGVKAAHHAVHQASAVTCGLITCSHGKVGQACTVAGYPGIIVQSSPTQLACDPKPGNFPSVSPPTPNPPGQPSPVSGQAQLTSSCTTGLYDESSSTFYTMADIKAGGMTQATANGDTAADGYQVTLTNNGNSTADVTGLAVVLYGEGGNELTSDQESTGSTFITPGQSLTFTEHPWDSYTLQNGSPAVGPYAVGQEGAVDAGATCQLVQWYAGQ